MSVTTERPVFLTREGQSFRMSFAYNERIVTLMKSLPYSNFDPETKSWTCLVCKQSLEALRKMFYDGLTDVSVDDLLKEGEEVQACKEATLRSGSVRRPFVVATATRDDRLFSRLRSIPGAQWEKNAGGVSYPSMASAALAELVQRGVMDDPERLLSSTDVVINFDARTGKFVVRGDARAQVAFDHHFPGKDVYEGWKAKGIDVSFSDPFTEEMYKGELARAAGGKDIEGILLPLFPYQKENVAVALERSGLGVYDSPGLGKCLRGESRVWVNGSQRRIDELWAEQAVSPEWDGEGEWALPTSPLKVQSVDSHGKALLADVSRLYRQPVKETLRKVTLDDGSSITLTRAHHLLSETKGWTTDIQAGDRFAVPGKTVWEGEAVDPELVRFLAWQISEGYEGATPSITQKDTDVLRMLHSDLLALAARYSINVGTPKIAFPRNSCRASVLYWARTGWQTFLYERGYTYGERSAGKSIPDFIMQGDAATTRLFLREYFAAEGHVSPGQFGVEISSASPVLMGQLVQLLRRHGVWMRHTVKHKMATNGKRIKRPYSVGLITGESMRTFAREIGIADAKKQATLEELAAVESRTNLETVGCAHLVREALDVSGLRVSHIGVHYSTQLLDRHLSRSMVLKAAAGVESLVDGSAEAAYRANPATWARGGSRWREENLAAYGSMDTVRLAELAAELRERAGADLHWATVVSVEDVEFEGYVYDLEVPVHHNFVAEGILCHNTATGIAWGHELVVNRGALPRVVVIVPGAVRTQWGREIEKFTGCTDVVVVDGDKKKRIAAYEAAKTARWMVVNYDVLHRDYKLIAPLVSGAALIFDEAHKIKNPTSSRTKASRNLNARAARRLALTGTPVENDPGEWYSILSGIVAPGIFGSPTDFFSRYSYPGKFGGWEGARNLPELRDRSRPLYMRHTKDQVATHLPPLRVQHLPLDPDPAYAAALKRAHKEARDEIKDARIEKMSHSGTPLDDDEWNDLGAGSEMTAVGMLRLMCSSPRLLTGSESDSAKVMVESGLVPEVDGPKLDELRTMAIEMQGAQDRMVVFTFSKRMADLMAQRFSEDGVRYVMFTGSTNTKDRDAAVLAFTTPATEENPGPTVFVATDAAAEGLNLGKCCSTLVNFDMPWTPAKAIQRSNRIHRLDGTHPKYLVINMTLRGTLEEGILRMLEQKADLQDALFGEEGGRRLTTGRGGRSIFEDVLKEWE